MPAGKAPKGAGQASPASGGDRIGALPDETLHHVLSFLPAQQAVQTCVLARRWRHLWKSATGLRIVGADGEAPVPFWEVREFVDCLLLLRGSSPLETFELSVVAAAGVGIDVRHVRLWIIYALQCKLQVLRLSFHRLPPASTRLTKLRLEDPSLASRHLTKLEIRGLAFNNNFLDFSRCPELQDLRIEDCGFKHAERISSQSLRHLSIKRATFNRSSRARILAPNLASLVLEVTAGRTPTLEKMPLLVKSSVIICEDCKDCCSRSNYGDCGDETCGGCIPDDSASVILHGMSQAKSLLLLAYPDKVC
jgi:hypothetical protein